MMDELSKHVFDVAMTMGVVDQCCKTKHEKGAKKVYDGAQKIPSTPSSESPELLKSTINYESLQPNLILTP